MVIELIHSFRKMKTMFLITLVSISFSAPTFAAQTLQKLDDQSYAALSATHGPHLDVRVKDAADLSMVLKIYTGQFTNSKFSTKAFGIKKMAKNRALIPYTSLSNAFKRNYIQVMWPKDKLKGKFWHHRVTYNSETLWTLATIFTGKGSNFRQILKASGRVREDISIGNQLKIPIDLIPGFLIDESTISLSKPKEPIFAIQTELKEETVISDSDVVPEISAPGKDKPKDEKKSSTTETTNKIQQKIVEKLTEIAKNTAKQNQSEPSTVQTTPPAKVQETPPSIAQKTPPAKVQNESPSLSKKSSQTYQELMKTRAELSYGTDTRGRYAIYKLKAGEAIYSSVVVRFCGLVAADEVNRVAAEIIARNSIKDETDLPIGFPIRIPYDLIEAEFKAEDDAEYLAYLKNLEDVSRVNTIVKAKNLSEIYLILDAGHGGSDPGASFKHIWEDDYVYDIICRVKQKLEVESAATVYTTVLDPSVKYSVQNVSAFRRDTDEVLLTTPRFKLNSSRVTTDGVNLRWMLANYHYKKLLAKGVKPENIIFASFHADSLHSSLRGSMIYVPDARKSPREVRPPLRLKNYREYNSSRFRQSQKELLTSQALSTSFARNLIHAMGDRKVSVHRQKPIRTVIFRKGYRKTGFIPAVLRNNQIPTRCLIEVSNLNNRHDQKQMKSPSFRQKFADAFVAAVYKTYGINSKTTASSNATLRARK